MGFLPLFLALAAGQLLELNIDDVEDSVFGLLRLPFHGKRVFSLPVDVLFGKDSVLRLRVLAHLGCCLGVGATDRGHFEWASELAGNFMVVRTWLA